MTYMWEFIFGAELERTEVIATVYILVVICHRAVGLINTVLGAQEAYAGVL